MKKFVGFIVVLAVAVGAFLWWRHSSAPASGPEEETKGVAEVTVAPLKTQKVGKTIDTVGTVQSSAAGAVAFAMSYDCIIKAVAAPVGSRVAQGEAVAEVEPTPDAKLALDSARGSANLAKEALEAAKQKYALKLITNDDLRTAQQAANDAGLKVESLTRRMTVEGGKLTAPLAGVVTKFDPTIGSVVPAGTAIFTLAADEHLEARLAIEASDLGAVKAGQPVSVLAVARDDGTPVSTTVASVGSVVDPATGSADVHVGLPADGGFYPGEHVRAEIEIQSETGLAVPRSAVLPDDDKRVLYTVSDHKAVKHEVEVKLESRDLVEVSAKDLKEGDSVVTQGNYELEDGMAVRLPGESPAKDDDDAKAGAKDASGGGKDEAKPAADKSKGADDEKAAPAKKDAPKSEEKP